MCMSTTLGVYFVCVSCQKQINIDECLEAGSFMLQLNSLDDKNSAIIERNLTTTSVAWLFKMA